MDFYEEALKLHEQYKGKLEIKSKVALKTKEDLCIAYTPGVAAPCMEIHKDEANAYRYTARGNLVAVISDGTAVLGLGDIGPKAAMPVMEGKAVLFKEFAGIDAFPICLDTQDTEEIIQAITWLAPSFGGINLEDIASPKCFEIEKRLEEALDIPVFHDDQHGTAIVVTAALLNALKVTGRRIEDCKAVLNGPGAAGTAIIKMLAFAGIGSMIACDEFGILYDGREEGMTAHKKELLAITNKDNIQGSLSDAIKDADIFIGVSVAGALKPEMVSHMAPRPIVFALANPTPEIMYENAIQAGVAVMGTGRSDFPNQINNVLAFPGIFRGALDARARDITYPMKLAAAKAIAALVGDAELRPDYIIPSAFDERVAAAVAGAVKGAVG